MSIEGRLINTEEAEKAPSMNEEQTIAFLEKNGVKRLSPENFQPHQPILCVLEDFYRGDFYPGFDKKGPFSHLPQNKRPSIARLDDPTKIGPAKDGGEFGRTIYDLSNEHTRVDFYALDPITEEITLVFPEYKQKSYQTRDGNVFESADELFARGKK